jgi:DNA-binding beta-propeller fold protein YncE
MNTNALECGRPNGKWTRHIPGLLTRLSVNPTLGRGLLLLLFMAQLLPAAEVKPDHRYLYVAVPGIRNYLEYGGHGLVVFDIDHGHKFVKRIKTSGLDTQGKPLNVKGVCANAETKRIYITTTRTLTCLDLVTEQILWEKPYGFGCDRMALSPDGKIIYLPSLEGPVWYVVNALNGDVITKITPNSGAHNTVYGNDGSHVYLAGLRSPFLTVAETVTHTSNSAVGPFSAPIRPFTVNSKQTLCFVCINELLGFEVGDIKSGKKLYRVEVEGFQKGEVKRHGCPSHGIGLTPDEKQLWVSDGHNQRMHIFDATTMPPKQVASIELRDQPGWITFSMDGRLAYPSTGDVIDVASRKIVTTLKDETGADVQSEKLLEIDFKDNKPVRAGNQFGVGRTSIRGN